MGFDNGKDTSVWQIFEEMNSLECILKREKGRSNNDTQITFLKSSTQADSKSGASFFIGWILPGSVSHWLDPTGPCFSLAGYYWLCFSLAEYCWAQFLICEMKTRRHLLGLLCQLHDLMFIKCLVRCLEYKCWFLFFPPLLVNKVISCI